MKILTTLLLLLAINAYSNEWNQTDKNLYKGYLGIQIIDTIQTKNMITCQRDYTCPNIIEANPLLHPYPTTRQLVLNKVAYNLVAYQFLDKYSPNDRTRRIALVSMIIVSAFVVSKNHKNGLSFKIKI